MCVVVMIFFAEDEFLGVGFLWQLQCRVDKDKKLRRGEEGLMNSDFCVITPFLKLIEGFSRGNPSFQYDLSFFRVSSRSITTMEIFYSVWFFSLKGKQFDKLSFSQLKQIDSPFTHQ